MPFPSLPAFKQLISPDTAIFWFRRDLRLDDNTGLFHALNNHSEVLPLFIFDTTILEKLEDPDDARVSFIHDSLHQLGEELRQAGSTLVVLHGNPVDIFRQLAPRAVYTNHDYEPYGRERDTTVQQELQGRGIAFHSSKDIVVLEREEVLKADQSPYTVFTPYSRKWKEVLKNSGLPSWKTRGLLSHLKKCDPLAIPTLEELGFKRSNIIAPERKISQSIIRSYEKTRDFPGLRGTTRLSVHLRFGTVSIRKLVALAEQENAGWLNELIWREFYHMILWHFPHASTRAFKPAYENIAWRNDPQEFQQWCDGQTGYPMVDAGMRELNNTGFMHNRVRMVTASFLTKHLLIDWRWGEAYFAKKLLDFDLAANNGGWQWAAGSGCDAAPYFRVFNPALQAAKFDPESAYIKKWVPEMGTSKYPQPMVKHDFARLRAIDRYKSALKGQS